MSVANLNEAEKIYRNGQKVEAIYHGSDQIYSAFLPTQIGSIVGWYDASRTDTISYAGDGSVHEVANRVDGGFPLRALTGQHGSGGPSYDPTFAGGKGGFEWSFDRSFKGLGITDPSSGLVDIELNEFFIVCQYKDGTISPPESYRCIFSDIIGLSTFTYRGVLEFGADGNLYDWGKSFTPTLVSINGGDWSPKFSPRPLGVARFSSKVSRPDPNTPFKVCNIGGQLGLDSRSWNGHICEVITYSNQLSDQEAQAVEQYLRRKWRV